MLDFHISLYICNQFEMFSNTDYFIGTVIFVNVDGQKKIIAGHVTELEFDNDVENTGLW